MTANELADWIENGSPFGDYETAKQAVTMLREQAKEIEDLKTFITVNRMQILDALDNVDAILKRARNTDV